MAYVEPPAARAATDPTDLLRGTLAPVHVRRGEGLSVRRLVLTLDVLALGAFVAIQGDLTGAAYAVLTLLALKAAGVYGPRIRPRVDDDFPRILAAVAVPVMALPFLATDERVVEIVVVLPLMLLTLLVGRSLTYAIVSRARRTGRLHDRVLIVGAGDRGTEMERLLTAHPEFGLEPIGFVDEVALTALPLPLLGGVVDLPKLTAMHGVDRVIVAEWEGDDAEIVPRLRSCAQRHVHVHVAPSLFQLGTAPTHPSTDWLWTTPVVRLPEAPHRTRAWLLKRALDVVVVGLALVFAAPLFAVLALAVRLSGPGPVFFRQVRLTQGGRPFELLKFRTMPVNDASETRWGNGELRPTRLGRLMRATGLDELPQLVNILRGEMSLVGPRPERPHFVESFSAEIPGYDDRHRVPAGLTGWAQVHGLRGETSIEERAMFDNEYIEYWSLWRDVVILFRTVKSILLGEGR